MIKINLRDAIGEAFFIFLENTLAIAIKKYFTANAETLAPLDNIKGLKKDHSLRVDLKNLEYAHQIMASRYQQNGLPELEKLIKMLEEELP